MPEPILPPTVHGGQHKLDQLLGYCARGWRLLPLWEKDEHGICVCRERERCTSKHPRIRWQDPPPGQCGATSDLSQVRKWHDAWPQADWATVLDELFVVDVDRKHGGMETLADVEENFPDLLGITLEATSPGGGRQYFYRQPPERDVVTIEQGRLAGLTGFEIKGLRRSDGSPGHYVGVPPSRGRRWLNGQEPDQPSPYLLQRIRQATGRSTTGHEPGEAFDWFRALTPGAVGPGERDRTLLRGACSLRALSVPDSLAIPLLRHVVSLFVNTDGEFKLEDANSKWDYVKRRWAAGSTVEVTDVQRAFVEDMLRRWAR